MDPAGRLRQLNKELEGGAARDGEGDLGFSIKIFNYIYIFQLSRKIIIIIIGSTARSMWDLSSQIPGPRISPTPLHWKRRVLTTGPSGKSLH